MDILPILILLLTILAGVLLLSIILFLIIPQIVWSVLRYLLLAHPINFIHWWCINPFRRAFNKYNSSSPTGIKVRKAARIIFYLLFIPRFVLGFLFYLGFTPFRIWSSFYYNILLFYALSLRDNILDWIGFNSNKKLEDYNIKEFIFWIGIFFKELPNFIVRLFKMLFQGFSMFILDCVIPAITVYHGTDKNAVNNIVKEGKWMAGKGDYGGLGIYFGIRQDVAEYYGNLSGGNSRVLIVRVSIPFIRTLCTIPEKIKIDENNYQYFKYPLKGGQGHLISKHLNKTPWRLTELWRDKTPPQNPKLKGWYELCLLKMKMHEPKSSWRIRALGELNKGFPGRLHRGIYFWPYTVTDWSYFFLACVSLPFIIKIIINLTNLI